MLTTMDHKLDALDEQLGNVAQQIEQLSIRQQQTMKLIVDIHEATIPRCFLYLPASSAHPAGGGVTDTEARQKVKKESSSILKRIKASLSELHDKLHPFDEFRLYFLCQGRNENILCTEPHVGYVITQPGKFLRTAGPVLRTMNTLLKLASVIGKCAGLPIPHGIPFLDHILSKPTFVAQFGTLFEQTADNLQNGLDQVAVVQEGVEIAVEQTKQSSVYIRPLSNSNVNQPQQNPDSSTPHPAFGAVYAAVKNTVT